MTKKDPFAVTNEEYYTLNDTFGELAYYAAWQLMRKNVKNNHTEDLEDVTQQLNMAIMRAGRYYKRQVYIEDCLDMATQYTTGFMADVVTELKHLWANKTKHGANKKKFGDHQEALLEQIIQKCVPADKRPDLKAPLRFDKKFHTYCKAIAWNAQKSLGKKISRERSIRSSQVSLSQFDFMGSEM